MIPNKKTVANAPSISATTKIIIPFIIFPAYTVPIPGRKKDMIKANIGFATFSPPSNVSLLIFLSNSLIFISFSFSL